MTRRHTRFILAALLGGVLTLPVTASQQEDLQVVLRRAIETETVAGDPRGAIELYKKVAEGPDRALAATALLRMAGAYEKFGEKQARETYQRIVSEFADQRTQVAEAQARLAALAPTAGPGSSRQDLQSNSTWDGSLGPGKDTAFSVSADGQRFVYTDWETGDLARSDFATRRSSRFYGIDYDTGFFQRPALSPDGRRVAFAYYPNTSASRIEVDDFEGGARRVVYDESDLGNILIWDWSPDGTRVLLSYSDSNQPATLATLHVEHRTLSPLVTLNWEHPRRAEYSPDGRFIAYDSSKGGDRAIYLIDVAGGTETVLVDSQGEDDFPMWTADGGFLVFRTNRRGDWDLFGLAMEDGLPADGARLLESSLGQFSTLRGISDDGRLFVHERLDDGSSIGLASSVVDRVDTLEVTDVPKVGTIGQQRPVFGPNAQQVIFRAGRRLQAADLEGQTRQMADLEPVIGPFYPASVSPDGKELAVIAYAPGGRQLLIRSAESGEPLREFLAPEGQTFALPVRWAADQRTLYVVLATSGAGARDVAVVDAGSGRILETTSVPTGSPLTIAFSPSLESVTYWDGTRLIVRSLVDGTERAHAIQLNTFRRVVWAADSRSLLFGKPDDNALYALDVDTGEERVLVTDMEGWGVSDTSPDGRHWALVRQTGGWARVWFLEHFLPAPGGQTIRR